MFSILQLRDVKIDTVPFFILVANVMFYKGTRISVRTIYSILMIIRILIFIRCRDIYISKSRDLLKSLHCLNIEFTINIL